MRTDVAGTCSRFLDIDFDRANYREVAERLERLALRDTFTFVVTPNVDHVLMLHPDSPTNTTRAFRQAYAAAELRLCDSRILQRLARFHAVTLDVVTGSDLTAYLFENGRLDGRKIAIIGGDAAMARELRERFPAIEIVQHQPPMGVLHDTHAIEEIIGFIEQERAHYVMLAIGAPQSEIIAHRCQLAGKSAGVGLCIGASIEFILGRKQRAPTWIQHLNLEWAFRLASEPRRLWRRYLVEGPRILVLSARWRRTRPAATAYAPIDKPR
ncbi:MAG: WecB/TagA/CpsF family glycosyltransferase [Sphingopyxis solisilvae]|uniref:WecB/TagA/CpsF family glycosyltransferase n=1 Tax=Sphingopyxis solisilvae TaxID=1886788 RepID=UPI004035500C